MNKEYYDYRHKRLYTGGPLPSGFNGQPDKMSLEMLKKHGLLPVKREAALPGHNILVKTVELQADCAYIKIVKQEESNLVSVRKKAVERVNKAVADKLKETDWMVTRAAEGYKPVPDKVIEERKVQRDTGNKLVDRIMESEDIGFIAGAELFADV